VSGLLQGQYALVTGANSGVGKGIALELARAGCNVAVNYYEDPAAADETAEQIRSLGVEAWTAKADVGVSADVERMFGEMRKQMPQLDLLVNNAGVQTWAALLDVTEADWDRVIRTNLKGCFLCTQAAARWMKERWMKDRSVKERKPGSIVNIGSGCNKHPFPRLVAYTASKGGIEQFTKVAAIELAEFGIRVNCVAPGAIVTERTLRDDPEFDRAWSKATPLGRIGTPGDIGQAVVFLASEQASFISGQTIWVDGAAFTMPNWAYQWKTSE
jgi:NAD(P)-dependent dehydrogenase (short-subunit alcohol dehydrogenase family)